MRTNEKDILVVGIFLGAAFTKLVFLVVAFVEMVGL